MALEDMAEGMGVSSPVGLGLVGAAALVLRSKKGRRALRTLAVGATGLVLGIIDSAKDMTKSVRAELQSVADEARSMRTKITYETETVPSQMMPMTNSTDAQMQAH